MQPIELGVREMLMNPGCESISHPKAPYKKCSQHKFGKLLRDMKLVQKSLRSFSFFLALVGVGAA